MVAGDVIDRRDLRERSGQCQRHLHLLDILHKVTGQSDQIRLTAADFFHEFCVVLPEFRAVQVRQLNDAKSIEGHRQSIAFDRHLVGHDPVAAVIEKADDRQSDHQHQNQSDFKSIRFSSVSVHGQFLSRSSYAIWEHSTSGEDAQFPDFSFTEYFHPCG